MLRVAPNPSYDAWQGDEALASTAVCDAIKTYEDIVQDTARFNETTLWLLAVRDHRDKAAFAKLFDHFAPRLKTMLSRGGFGEANAEDVIQDVMLSVWHKAGQFDPHRAEAGAWIYRIARNRQIDVIRRAAPPLPEETPEQVCEDPDAVQVLGLEQESARLREALSRLDSNERQLLEQSFFEDHAHAKLSVLNNLPLGTIKSRIRRGLEQLRRELKDLR